MFVWTFVWTYVYTYRGREISTLRSGADTFSF